MNMNRVYCEHNIGVNLYTFGVALAPPPQMPSSAPARVVLDSWINGNMIQVISL